jgi:hypothetical protein
MKYDIAYVNAERSTDIGVCEWDDGQHEWGGKTCVEKLSNVHVFTEDELKERDKVFEDYIELLSKGLSQSAGFLDVHNWKYAESDIQKGVELREKIANLKSLQTKEPDETK